MADWSTSGRRISSKGHRNHFSSAVALNDGDFEEEDVWSTMNNETVDFSRTTPRPVPRSSHHQHRCSSATEVRTARQSSVPVSIPDWSKIYGKGKVRSSRDGVSHGDDDVDDDEEEEQGEMVPPHEWIARKLSRAQISSSSMCEGLGRTLKGRDLSKVRNAILSKTGFLE